MHMDTAKYPHEQFVEDVIPAVFPKGNYWMHLVFPLWLVSMMIIMLVIPASLFSIGTVYEEANGAMLDYETGLMGLSLTLFNIAGNLLIVTILFWITSFNIDLINGDLI